MHEDVTQAKASPSVLRYVKETLGNQLSGKDSHDLGLILKVTEVTLNFIG